jgi:hypothetical protein
MEMLVFLRKKGVFSEKWVLKIGVSLKKGCFD